MENNLYNDLNTYYSQSQKEQSARNNLERITKQIIEAPQEQRDVLRAEYEKAIDDYVSITQKPENTQQAAENLKSLTPEEVSKRLNSKGTTAKISDTAANGTTAKTSNTAAKGDISKTIANNVSSAVARHTADIVSGVSKLGQAEDTDEAKYLRNQAQELRNQAQVEEKNAQKSMQIANRNVRATADTDATANATRQNAMTVANRGNVSAGAAALARTVGTNADYNSARSRSDAQRAEGIKNTREAFGAQQSAIQKEQEASTANRQAKDVNNYNRAIYNLSNAVGRQQQDTSSAEADDVAEEQPRPQQEQVSEQENVKTGSGSMHSILNYITYGNDESSKHYNGSALDDTAKGLLQSIGKPAPITQDEIAKVTNNPNANFDNISQEQLQKVVETVRPDFWKRYKDANPGNRFKDDGTQLNVGDEGLTNENIINTLTSFKY